MSARAVITLVILAVAILLGAFVFCAARNVATPRSERAEILSALD